MRYRAHWFRVVVLAATTAAVGGARTAPARAAAPAFRTEPLAMSVLLRSDDLGMPERGRYFFGTGIEVQPGWRQPFSGFTGTLVRTGVYRFQVAFSEQISVRVDGSLLDSLNLDRRASRPRPGFDVKDDPRDAGTPRVATLLRLVRERGRRPGFGLVFAATVPTTDDTEGIGLDTIDVFGSVVWGWRRPQWELVTNAGVGILTAPSVVREQNDVLTWAVKGARLVRGRWTLLGEVRGHAQTRDKRLPGTEDRATLRAGIAWQHPRLRCETALVQGLTETEGDLGIGVAVSWLWGNAPLSAAGAGLSAPPEGPAPRPTADDRSRP